MADKRLELHKTVTYELTGPVRDLILFVHSLKERTLVVTTMTDEQIRDEAIAFHETQHGED